MMYSIEDLKGSVNQQVALRRYLHKFENDRRQIKKLKLHEKDFLFSSMRAIIRPKDGVDLNNLRKDFHDDVELWRYLEENGLAEKAYSLYEIAEADDFLFYTIILNYFNNLHFLTPSVGPYGPLSKKEIERDHKYFRERLRNWTALLCSNRGLYISEILKEYNRKKKLLEEQRKSYTIGYNKYLYKLKELAVISFGIYYKTRYFFDNQKDPYYVFKVDNLKFVFDIYSYVHILSRHYMPSMNDFDIERSFNHYIPFIDIDDLPSSIEQLLKDYSTHRKLKAEDQYIIFQFKSFCYILWFDFRKSAYLKERAMQIRTFYKIQDKRDIDKFTALKRMRINADFYYFV